MQNVQNFDSVSLTALVVIFLMRVKVVWVEAIALCGNNVWVHSRKCFVLVWSGLLSTPTRIGVFVRHNLDMILNSLLFISLTMSILFVYTFWKLIVHDTIDLVPIELRDMLAKHLPEVVEDGWHMHYCIGLLMSTRWWAKALRNPFFWNDEIVTRGHCGLAIDVFFTNILWTGIVFLTCRIFVRFFCKRAPEQKYSKPIPVVRGADNSCVRFYRLFPAVLFDDDDEGRRARQVIFSMRTDFATYLPNALADAKQRGLGVNPIAAVALHCLQSWSHHFPPGGTDGPEVLLQCSLLDVFVDGKLTLKNLNSFQSLSYTNTEITYGFTLAFLAVAHCDLDVARSIVLSLGHNVHQEARQKGKNKHKLSKYGGHLSPKEAYLRRKLSKENREYYEALRWSGLEGDDYRDAVELSDEFLSWRESIRDNGLFAMEDGMGFTPDEFFQRYLRDQAVTHAGNRRGNNATRLLETVKVTAVSYREAGRRCRFGGYMVGLKQRDYELQKAQCDDSLFDDDIYNPYGGNWGDDSGELDSIFKVPLGKRRYQEGLLEPESTAEGTSTSPVDLKRSGWTTPVFVQTLKSVIPSVPIDIRNDVNVIESIALMDTHGHTRVELGGNLLKKMADHMTNVAKTNHAVQTQVLRRLHCHVEQEGNDGFLTSEEGDFSPTPRKDPPMIVEVATVVREPTEGSDTGSVKKKKRKPKSKGKTIEVEGKVDPLRHPVVDLAKEPTVEVVKEPSLGNVNKVTQESAVSGTNPVPISRCGACAVFVKVSGKVFFHGNGYIIRDGGVAAALTNAHTFRAGTESVVVRLFDNREFEVPRQKLKLIEANRDILVVPIGDVDVPVVSFHESGVLARNSPVYMFFYRPADDGTTAGEWDMQIGTIGGSGKKLNDAGQEIAFTQFTASTRSGYCRAGVFSEHGMLIGGHHWSSTSTQSGVYPAFDNDAATPGVRKDRKQTKFQSIPPVSQGQHGFRRSMADNRVVGTVGAFHRANKNMSEEDRKKDVLVRVVPTHYVSDDFSDHFYFDHSSYNHRGASAPFNHCQRQSDKWPAHILTPVQTRDRVWDFIPGVDFEELNASGVGLRHWHVKPGIKAVHSEVQKFCDHKIDCKFVEVFNSVLSDMAASRLRVLRGPYIPIDPIENPAGAIEKLGLVFSELNKSSKAGASDINRTTKAYVEAIGGGDFEKGTEMVIEYSLVLLQDLYSREKDRTPHSIDVMDFPAVVFAKADKYGVGKLEKDGGRSIQAVDLFYKMLWGFFFYEHDFEWNSMNTDIARRQTHLRCGGSKDSEPVTRRPEDGTFVGINANTGLPHWRKMRMLGANMVWSTDITGFDRDMPSVLIKGYFEWYLKQMVELPLTALYTFFFSSVQTTMVLPDGTVYRKFSGNLSGKNDTLMMNCVINTACSAIALTSAIREARKVIFRDAEFVDGEPGSADNISSLDPQYDYACHFVSNLDDGEKVVEVFGHRRDPQFLARQHTGEFNPFDYHSKDYVCSQRGCKKLNIVSDETVKTRERYVQLAPGGCDIHDARFPELSCSCFGNYSIPSPHDVSYTLKQHFCEIVGDDNRTFLHVSEILGVEWFNEVFLPEKRRRGIKYHSFDALSNEVFGYYMQFWNYFLPWEVKVEGVWRSGMVCDGLGGLEDADFKNIPPFCGRRLVACGPSVFMPLAEVNRTMIHVLSKASGDQQELLDQRMMGVSWALLPNILLHQMGVLVDPCVGYLIMKDGQFAPELAAIRFCDSLIVELMLTCSQE